MATNKHAPGIGLSLILLVSRLLVGGLLVYAAYHKLMDPQGFAFAIEAYKVLPDHLVHVSAFAIPWTEALAGIALIVGFWSRSSAFLCIALAGSFIFAITSVLVRADVAVTDCSCFGKANFICTGAPGWCHIALDSVMLILAGLVALWGGGSASLDRLIAKRPHDAPVLLGSEDPHARPL